VREKKKTTERESETETKLCVRVCVCGGWVRERVFASDEVKRRRRIMQKRKKEIEREERGGLDGERERTKTARETTSLARFFLERKIDRGRKSVKESEKRR